MAIIALDPYRVSQVNKLLRIIGEDFQSALAGEVSNDQDGLAVKLYGVRGQKVLELWMEESDHGDYQWETGEVSADEVAQATAELDDVRLADYFETLNSLVEHLVVVGD